MIRSTSTMRATLCRRVTPRFSSDAQSSATAAFLLEFTAMEPLSFRPPCTRRCERCGAPPPIDTICWSSASLIRVSISSDRFWPPCSMRLMALWLVPTRSASCAWSCCGPCGRPG